MNHKTIIFFLAISLSNVACIGENIANFQTATLNALIAKKDYKTILKQICPEAVGTTCRKTFESQCSSSKGIKLLVEDENTNRQDFSFNDEFFLKTYVAPMSLIEYAFHEINIGLKIRDSRVNKITNLMELDDCCSEIVSQGLNKAYKFSIRTQYFPLGSLRQLFTTTGDQKVMSTLSWRVSVVYGILAGIHILHDKDYSHRDIKPENIIMANPLTPLLNDFGYSKKIQGTSDTIVGTPAYLSPEVSAGDEYTKNIDVYNAGIVIFEVFNHQLYSLTPTPLEDIKKHCVNWNEGDPMAIHLEKRIYCGFFEEMVVAMVNPDHKTRVNVLQAADLFEKGLKGILEDQKGNQKGIVEDMNDAGIKQEDFWWRFANNYIANAQVII